MRNIADMFCRRVATSPDRTGLVFRDTRLTWREVYDRAWTIAEALREAGVRRGDVVGILAPHSPAQAAALLGVALADAAFSIVNPLLKPHQIRHQIHDANMKAMLGTAEYRKSLGEVLNDEDIPWYDLALDGSMPAARASRPPETAIDSTVNIPSDVGTIIYTSGSTGKPKGVVVPHRTLLDGARIVSSYLGITEQDTTLGILSFGFDYGLNQLMTAIYRGARLVIHQYVFPLDLLRLLEREHITGMAAVPSIFPALLEYANRRSQQLDLPDLRYLTTAGGAHSPALLRQLEDTFHGTEIIVMYGLTESFRSTYLPYSELHRGPGCIGRPVPEVEIKVLNAAGEACAPGEKGELVHRGAFVTYGYLNDAEMTAARFIDLPGPGPGCVPEKAVRSGDLVSMDADGYLFFHGRMDAQIKSRGYRVSPDEVAEAVTSVQEICRAAAFGLPDAAAGEVVAVAYETHRGTAIDEGELSRQLASTLPDYATPRCFRFYPRLPQTPNGKLDVSGMKQETAVDLGIDLSSGGVA
ncbi:MAG: AMP-binding protein [bacterium]|nr:AMP-binding protein [bacterium]